ncbi:Qat anti-phage system TatD family nuclease QatD [Promicromonospora sp. NPDC050880]|uniref:Qat anti-phage system TatD family nuclease QatD n=1 Tax=Promicromonospora sp. NPDC050880 TaxID=3364406 RepID=UPI0037BA6C83
MIDFHCHLDLYPDPFAVADEAQARSVGVLSVTTTPSAWPGTSRIAQGRPVIRTALGLHPQLARERIRELSLFDRYLPETRFVGEVGLDGSPGLRSSWNQQVEVFEHVLASCSAAGDKIVSIHSRRAATAVLDRLDQHLGIQRPVLHWFSGTAAELARAMARDCWFSVGPSMLASAKGRAHIRDIPRSRVLLETDGPFTQRLGAPLQPWDVYSALGGVAQLWEMSEREATTIFQNNERLLLA